MSLTSPPSGPARNHRRSAWQSVIHLGEQLLAFIQEASLGRLTPDEVSRSQQALIQETASRLLKGKARLWLNFDPTLEGPEVRFPLSTPPPTGLMQAALNARETCCLPDPATAPENAAPNYIQAAVPLILSSASQMESSRVLGVLQVERPVEQPFRPAEIELLEGLSVQAALALQALEQLTIERWRVQQLSLVSQVSAELTHLRDLDELSHQVTHRILESFDYYYVALFTLQPGQKVLHFNASAGPRQPHASRSQDGSSFSPSFKIQLGEGMIGAVAQSGEAIHAADVSREARYRYTDALPETRSELSLPLKIEDRVLGVLDVQSDQPHAFDQTDLLVLSALAHNIAVAIEGAQLYSALRQRAAQLSAIGEVSNAIASILDTEELLTEVVQMIHRRFGYRFVHLFTVHNGRRKIFFEAGIGMKGQVLRKDQHISYDLDDTAGIIPWVARQGETILANDVESEPRYRPSPLPPDETRSELTVPLVFGGEVLGVLDVQSDHLDAFGEEDRFLFEALADNIAVALRNAYLYRSESWRRQAADSLREVAGLLSADADLDQVLDAILKELERTLPCDLSAIWLVDEERLEAGGAVPAPLQLAAVHGPGLNDLTQKMSADLSEILQLHANFLGEAEFTSWLTEAVEADQPIIRTPQSPFEPLGAVMGYGPAYSAIATPLRVGEQRLGTLVLIHREQGRYGSESRALTAAFASYAAVAIENTRLYEAAHEQAWVSTVLLQVAEATQTLTNLNELLATVVRITPMLVGVRACAIYLLDDDNVFVPSVCAGLTPQQQAEFERWRFAPGDAPALDQVLEMHQPILLDSDNEDPRLSEVLFAGPEENLLIETEMLALVPLLGHGEVMGVLVVDYSSAALGSPHFDEQLAIIQGIAHQTSIAVENIRLLKAQKEEAYVSVALLQVAQAVVSTNGLEDILGAIVRITPILVGVKRTLLYLWDHQLGQFWLAQSYGVSRNAGVRAYLPGQFPLLDAVRERDQIVALPAPPEQEGVEPPESWSFLPVPEVDEQAAILERERCLLLAFPLSVKGEGLGVMLVEEPELPGVENTISGANRRLREKRMEITTGISQQAALAIQNDRLQREMVERERLEREMQLAREIQRTFLPHEVPILSGWELKVRWRTARQVGGDFYDYFTLPDGKMVLLIADVADKGMPAALFMTLVRTLIRATVQEFASPAAVLSKVNDILVPDAPGGMFVTLVYGLLDLETGLLEYANAGHNPPLLIRAAGGEIERLQRSGMALGVLEGTLFTERTLQMEPGDSLVLYTDGVTEAFSPQEEMYGEARLRQTLLSAAGASAQQVLDAVDTSVSAFLNGPHLSDDLTLMVLHRHQQRED